jgi:hypothetical protein
MTFEEWNEACSQANRLDAYLARHEAFEHPETPLDGLILFCEARQYALLNKSGGAIPRLMLEVVQHDDLKRRLSEPKTWRLEGLPKACYVPLGEADPRPQRGTAFILTRVEWPDAPPWEGRRRLDPVTPRSVSTRLDQLPLEKVDLESVRVEQ